MASNVVDLVMAPLGGETTAAIGERLGADVTQIEKAVAAGVPALLASIGGAARSAEGATSLATAALTQDAGLLHDPTAGLRDAPQYRIDQGQRDLDPLLGERQMGGLVGAISGYSGLDDDTSRSLLGLLAPVVLGVLGQQQQATSLDATGLARMLLDQKDNIVGAMPAGLAGALRAAGLLDRLELRTAPTPRPDSEPAENPPIAAAALQTPWMRYGIPAAIVVVVVMVAYGLLSGSDTAEDVADRAPETPSEAAATVEEAARETTAAVVGEVDVGQELTSVLESTTETLEAITDPASATAALPELKDIEAKLDGLAGLADQLPEDAKATVVQLIADRASALDETFQTVSAIPGVGEVIKPAMKQIEAKLAAFTA